MPLAAAEDGLFPAPFAKVHGERKTPVFGLVVSSVLVSGLMLMNYTQGLVEAFTFIILLATLTTLVPYAYSAAAQAHLYLTEPELFDRRHFVRDVAIAALAFAYSVWAITGLRQGHHRQGIRAAARRHPDLRRDEVVAGAAEPGAARARADRAPGRARAGRERAMSALPARRPTATRLHVGSEIGRLRRVILHRPDLELKRLTPRNKDELLFDDVLWVRRARQEHDAFADALAERGVEVLYLHELLGETLDIPAARNLVLQRTTHQAAARAQRSDPQSRSGFAPCRARSWPSG